MQNDDSNSENARPGGVSVAWLQCLGLSKAHAEAVVAVHREEVEAARAAGGPVTAERLAKQEPGQVVSSSDGLSLLAGWRAEADLLDSGEHPRRQGLPRRQVLQESCALRGCAADLERLVGGLASEDND